MGWDGMGWRGSPVALPAAGGPRKERPGLLWTRRGGRIGTGAGAKRGGWWRTGGQMWANGSRHCGAGGGSSTKWQVSRDGGGHWAGDQGAGQGVGDRRGGQGRGRTLGADSEPGLRLGDVDLDALGALGGRVLADGRGALGGHQALAGLLALRALQRALPDQRRGALRRLLGHGRRRPSLLIKAEGSGHYTASQDKLGATGIGQWLDTLFLFCFVLF